MAADRGWMYDVEDADRFLSHIFCSNLDAFLDFAFSNKAFVDNNRIKCPCLECDNKHFKTRNDVMFHLYEKGFTPNYTTWFAHGEIAATFQHEGESCDPMEDDNNVDECKCTVVDEVRPSYVNDTTCEPSCNSNVLEGTKGCQKNLKVKLTSELFKCKSNNKINMLALPENKTINIIKNHSIWNCPRVSATEPQLSIFKFPVEVLMDSGPWYVSLDVKSMAHRYILFNCEEVHEGSNYIREDLQDIAQRPCLPNFRSCTYKGCLINGYKFHTQKHSEWRVKKLSGVCVRGAVSNGHERDYYGILDEIIELKLTYRHPGSPRFSRGVVVLFMCKWFDTPGGVERKNDLVHIDSKAKLLTDNPFVLPSYTEQVFYAPHRSMSKELKDWWDAVKNQEEVKSQDEVKEHINYITQFNPFHLGTPYTRNMNYCDICCCYILGF
ncbi:transposon, En/Spm-like, Transposase-associated domain protein [Artemisia annua]|uniref:Transposon, En/Spm-like, Transposase-associated domain protein n=1 Tax=Artemisia annua TaxID=35608 RepID=A0A2U1LYD3_ARTAN|nr:transposon, En/Spm-like, Transposase-associated domain protein [Artemisia annua]